MFKSRSGSRGNPATHPPQSIEAVRRRARHRLIGAAVLVSLGVLGFSLLFDTQPRPISVDIPIEIPAKNAVLPIQAAKPVQPSSPAASVEPMRPVPSAGAVAGVSTNDSLSAREEVVDSVPATTQPAKTVVKPEKQPEPVIKPPAQKPDPAKVSAAEAERVQALLDGKPPVAVERIVVQVGAFADAARAQEVRLTLERAGLKTYTHVAETSEGKRIRVRLGPFASRAEADKAAVRVKALGLPAAILTL
ncbi:MAG: SPOR domain-containing protein [Hydrogenophaga sp.]|uniref:SPOR domain-containing protein n=1 Tax=Hydrogenophaga sp. TaxID=1904254 RepID=UPI002764918F|nr:SPOR domain-containing protein [Hydrogenophaga sp.]MDP2419064.1 SPOR domain-containing protein [Hydrogenophaga sp.]MDZ4187215.1 SPOR domain-containing protein [Hydrogenophaga sp.]